MPWYLESVFFCQGSLVEDCSHYGRVHHLFTELMSPSNWRVNSAVETNLKFSDPTSVGEPVGVEAIDHGEYATVLFTRDHELRKIVAD